MSEAHIVEFGQLAGTTVRVRYKGTSLLRVRSGGLRGRTSVPDELCLGKLRALVDEVGGVIPSAREVARSLSIGQDRARRLIAMLKTEREADSASLWR